MKTYKTILLLIGFLFVFYLGNGQECAEEMNLISKEYFWHIPDEQQEVKDAVLSSWRYSGAWPIFLYEDYQGEWTFPIDQLIDVSEHGIYPETTGTGLLIKNLLKNLDHSIQTILFFPHGKYLIELPLSIPSKVIIKGNGGDANDPLRTEFHFDYPDDIEPFIKGSCLTFSGGSKYSALEDIYLFDETDPDPFVFHVPDRFNDMVTIANKNKINGEYVYTLNCWMRGVESEKTRRFHVNIYAESITISGCYFHDSWSYLEGGRGYGVCLSKNSLFCRVENNIFRHLRHSMIFQYNTKQNVVAYNYSGDVNAFNTFGGIPFKYKASDLDFHGRHDNNIVGPVWNLCEGNKVERIFFDDVHDQNGPYNTIFRCNGYSDYRELKVEKVYGSEHQFMQNVVGTNAEPFTSSALGIWTKKWILKYGLGWYWDGPPDYSQTPSDQCSYYLSDRPVFYDLNTSWLSWPFVPEDDELIPAKYRFDRNNGSYGTYPPQTEVVYAGWGLYQDIYGPPNYKLTNGSVLKDVAKEYIAMDYIVAGPLVLEENNNIVFKAENSIILKPGFKVTGNNNYFYAKAGSLGKDKDMNIDGFVSGKPVLTTFELEPEISLYPDKSYFENSSGEGFEFKSESISLNQQIRIGPNPNNGQFKVFIPHDKIKGSKIDMTDIYGNKTDFSKVLNDDHIIINLRNNPKGVYMLYLYSGSMFKIKKIIYQ